MAPQAYDCDISLPAYALKKYGTLIIYAHPKNIQHPRTLELKETAILKETVD